MLERLCYHRGVSKNPHAVALGRLGGAKGGPARARALSARRRSEIARKAGLGRAQALSAQARKELAQRAARTRWAREANRIETARDAPEDVRKLLKSYDPAKLEWEVSADRYAVVVAILTRGNAASKRWLWSVLSRDQVRHLVREYAGSGCAEPDRALLRKQLRLSPEDIPSRPYLGFQMGRAM